MNNNYVKKKKWLKNIFINGNFRNIRNFLDEKIFDRNSYLSFKNYENIQNNLL